MKWVLFAGILLILSSSLLALDGNGLSDNPYLIQTQDDFDEFADVQNADVFWASGVYIRLDTDLDLTGKEYDRAVIAPDIDNTLWEYDGISFSAFFDGNDHTISNLSIDSINADNDYIALFGQISGENSEIKDLTLINCSVKGGNSSQYTAGIVAFNDSGTVHNCSVYGSINGREAGGICGQNSHGEITDCFANVTIYSRATAGGICSTNYFGSILDCHAEGTVEGRYDANYISGLCGLNTSSTIQRCSSSVRVIGGDEYAGGLCGFNYSDSCISECYATGNVTGDKYIGGFVGRNTGAVINDSYCTGNVLIRSYGQFSGGFCGENSGTVQNCYSIGKIDNSNFPRYYGGFCGSTDRSVIQNCYWSEDTEYLPGLGSLIYSAGGYRLSSNQMKSESNYLGWHNGLWKIEEGIDYPRLAWENKPGTVIDHVENKTYYGNGTDQPYELANADDIVCMSKRPQDWDKKFILVANIDMSSVLDYSPVSCFTGSLDGQNFTISNFTIDASSDGNNHCLGFLGVLQYGGAVKNVKVENVSITCGTFGRFLGGLCGLNNSEEIYNCHVTASFNTGDSTRSVGGLCGYNNCGPISYSSANTTFAVPMEAQYYGGLCGNNAGLGIVERCKAQINCTQNWGTQAVGGLCGANFGTSKISESFSTGTIANDRSGNKVGGLCGLNNGEISNCYSLVAIDNFSASPISGGLCGWLEDGTISDCFSAGAMTGEQLQPNSFCGLIRDADISASFWDNELSPQSAYYVGVEGKTTLEMYAKSTFTYAGWDFTSDDGNPALWQARYKDYPHFIWEGLSTQYVTVPDLERMLKADAITAIVDAGLTVGSITIAENADVPLNSVISQSYPAGTSLEVWTAINLIVTREPEMVTVPDVIGTTQSDAENAIIAAGFAVGTVTTSYNASVPAGTAMAQSPAGGTTYLEGSDIALTISLGSAISGSGTESEPFMIDSIDAYLEFSDLDNSAIYWAPYVHTHLTSDLDLADVSVSRIGISDSMCYQGFFNGNSHTISNLTINVPEDYYVGMFGRINASAKITNLLLQSPVVTGEYYVGALCGYNDGGSITLCGVDSAYIVGDECVGGLIGESAWHTNTDDTFIVPKIDRCYSTGQVNGQSKIGGLVGQSSVSQMLRSFSTANVNGNLNIGGLIGLHYGHVPVANCFSQGDVWGQGNVGGMVGVSYAVDTDCGFSNCYSSGQVNGTNSTGGLIGKNYSGVNFHSCYWDTDSSGLTFSDGGVGKPTQQMQDQAIYLNWDFDTPVWMINGQNYPRLIWHSPDIDDNGIVDISDFAILSDNWQLAVSSLNGADLNGDSSVSIDDLILIVQNWLSVDVIANHVSAIESATGIMYGKPDDSNDTVYVFELSVYTDSNVEKIEFLTPAGYLYEITNELYTETCSPHGCIETEYVFDEDEAVNVGNQQYEWVYEACFSNIESLDNYGDGWYEFTFYLPNGRIEQSRLFYGNTSTGEIIPQPTEEPVFTSPTHGQSISNPITFSWQECTDSNVSFIYFDAENEDNDDEIEYGQLDKSVTSLDGIDLSAGSWTAYLNLVAIDSSINIDDIDVFIAKFTVTELDFIVEP